MNRVGVILLDGTEVVVRVYEPEYDRFELVRYFHRDLINVDDHPLIVGQEIVEVITQMCFAGYNQFVDHWKLCSRNVPAEVIRAVSQTIGLEIETLTLIREQELLCKGVVTEG